MAQHLLGGHELSLSYPTRDVLDAVTVGVSAGDRIGVVGRNGDGKSTLLRLLAGRQQPDSGRVTSRRDITVGLLDQTDSLDDADTVGHAIVGDVDEHEWAADARIRDVLAGLLPGVGWEAAIGSLSGGQRRRVDLARLLVREDDVLLLDEPTNHLDIEAITWLARHLAGRWSASAGGLVVVTHDRWFLDAVCTTMWEVHDGTVTPFDGGYAAYILQRVERDRQAAVEEDKRRNLLRKELAWLRRGAPARSSKPKFRMDAAAALVEHVPPVRDTVALSSMAMQRLGKDVVDLVDVSVAWEGRPLLTDVTWRIAPGERTGILGVNGAGKSTLLDLIRGRIAPDAGRVKRGKTVKIATLTQRLDELAAIRDDRVSDVVARLRTSYRVDGAELTPGDLLERVGFTGSRLATPVRDLSGGQKRRLQLLLVLLDEPNVLILDEPTNDLDTDMLTAMEDLLDSFAGTLLVVSHDRYLIERVTDQQYGIVGGRLRHLPGGVDEYLRLRAAESRRGGAAGVADAAGVASAAESASGSTPAAELSGAQRRALEKELASLERRVEKLHRQAADARAGLAALDQSDYERLGAEMATITAWEAEASELEDRWLEVSTALE